jgi:predicted component of type VI protein secretion system
MKLSLVVLTPGKQHGKVLDIKLAQFLIGRDPQCHLRPTSPMISKRHCALIQRDGKVFIRDFDSTNGTLVNDQPVKGEVELHHDDQVKAGPLHFAIRLEAAPAARPTPAPPTKAAPPASESTVRAASAKTVTASGSAAKAPGAKPAAADKSPSGHGSEDDIAALLLSLGDDTDTGGTPISAGDIPDGSTVMEVAAQTAENDPAKPNDPSKSGVNKDPKAAKKEITGDTQVAAKAILDKYMKRPRNQSS